MFFTISIGTSIDAAQRNYGPENYPKGTNQGTKGEKEWCRPRKP